MRPGLWTGVLFGVTIASGCGRPGGPGAFSTSQSEFPIPDSGAPSPPPPIGEQTSPTCKAAVTSPINVMPARTTIAGAAPGGEAQDNTFRTAQLFSLFNQVCGGCHVDSNDGAFKVSATTFSTVVKLSAGGRGAEVYQLITSNDISGNPTTSVMPPYGIAYDSRASSDAVVQLATLLNLWLMQGSPPGSFTLPTEASGSSAGYAMSASLGAQLTNIGSCVPNKAAVGTSAEAMDSSMPSLPRPSSCPRRWPRPISSPWTARPWPRPGSSRTPRPIRCGATTRARCGTCAFRSASRSCSTRRCNSSRFRPIPASTRPSSRR